MRNRDGKILLIDLDAAVSFEKKRYAGEKYSSAYIPPEMIDFDVASNNPRVRSTSLLKTNEIVQEELVLASPQFDMWSLGVVMYQLCTNEPLFLSNGDSNLDDTGMKILCEFKDSFKQEKMNKIDDIKARNLISRLLSKDPLKRPLTSAVLDHPFLSGKSTSSRMIGQQAEYDIFLSYRVSTDYDHVAKIYELLIGKGLKVWWDKKCLAAGIPWEEGFCDGLVNSRAFICLISEAAIGNSFSVLTSESRCDNVLLEHQLAIELRSMGLIEYIYPIFIGTKKTDNELTYNRFNFGCFNEFPSISVNSVVEKLYGHLDRQALGSANNPNITIKEVISTISANQGGFIEGEEKKSFNIVVDSIHEMLHISKITINEQEVNVKQQYLNVIENYLANNKEQDEDKDKKLVEKINEIFSKTGIV